jgi:cytochrome b
MEAWLNHTPLLAVAAIALVLTLFAAMAGVALRARHDRRVAQEDAPRSGEQEGYIVTAVLGLLALLLGFTFALAVDRFENRRHLVLEEANAIEAIYLRAQLLQEPHRVRISRLLIEYTDNRIALGNAQPGRKRAALAATNKRLITDLWAATSAAFPGIKDLDFSSSFVDSMGRLMEMDAARKAARLAHVPVGVLVVLFVYVVVTALVLGYVLVDYRGKALAGFMLALLMLSLLLVIDIDRPTRGFVKEDQGPMENVQALLGSWPPEIFDRWLSEDSTDDRTRGAN